MRIPRTHDADPGLLRALRLCGRRAFTMANPQRLRLPARHPLAPPRDSDEARSAALRDGRPRGGADRRAALGGGHRRARATARPTGRRGVDGDRRPIRRVLDREFLEARGWSEGAIECFGLTGLPGVADERVLPGVSAGGGWRLLHRNLVEIDGGMDRLPRGVPARAAAGIRFGARMIALDQSETGVTVHYQTAGGRFAATGDYAIVTVPFPVLRHVEVLKPFSPGQAARHPPAPLRRLGQDPVPVPPPVLGGGRRDLRRRHRHRPADPGDLYYPDHGRETGRGRAPGQLHLVRGRPALGIAVARRPHRPRRSRTWP